VISRLLFCTVLFLPFYKPCLASENFIKITESFGTLDRIRPAISEEGDVASVEPQKVFIGNGQITENREIDLSTQQLEFINFSQGQIIHIRNGRELVFIANKMDVSTCTDNLARGVYRLFASELTPTTLLQGCATPHTPDTPKDNMSMSSNGTLAISTIKDSFGTLKTGPASGPISNLIDCPCSISNTGKIAINDSGQFIVQGEFGTSSRKIFFFDEPTNNNDYLTAGEFSIGANPSIDINDLGNIIFSINESFTARIDGSDKTFLPGIYLAVATPEGGNKQITTIVDNSGDFCVFGEVSINNNGHYAFSAQLRSSPLSDCTSWGGMDGIFNGPSPIENALILRGDEKLESHQYFDSILMGYLNNSDELSFITRYSEPLVSPIFVWKANFVEQYRTRPLIERFVDAIVSAWQNFIQFLIGIFNF
jgi:hypothetical protein